MIDIVGNLTIFFILPISLILTHNYIEDKKRKEAEEKFEKIIENQYKKIISMSRKDE